MRIPRLHRSSRLVGRALAPLALLGFLATPLAAIAADVTFRVTVPAETPAGDAIYIAGDFQGWNPGSPAHRLTEVAPQRHEITLSFAAPVTIQFKFTRGTWARVEKGPAGEEIANRVLAIGGSGTHAFTVARWADLAPSTITGDVSLVTVPGFLAGRRVWVYLPPGYHADPARRFPVLYMFDGQNVFDAATSFAGEWHVDETCQQLIPAGEIEPLIVVAVANGETARVHEYTPWPGSGGTGGGGEQHLQEFLGTLKPWVDATYRTLPDAAATGLAGSSLGGLMSLYAAYAHDEGFGRIASLSPSLWWSDHEMVAWANARVKPDARVSMDMGTRESGSLVDANGNGVDDSIDDLRAMRDVMLAQGFALGANLRVFEHENANHNEAAWAARLPDVLRWLYPPGTVAAPEVAGAAVDFRVAPNPFEVRTTLQFDTPVPARIRVTVHDVGGRRIRALADGERLAGRHTVEWNGRDDFGDEVGSGIYFVRLETDGGAVTRKVVLQRAAR